MNIVKNCIRSYVTSLIGLAIILATAYVCTFKDMNWIWEGFAGCFAGAVFLYLSDDEVKKYLKLTIEFLHKKFIG